MIQISERTGRFAEYAREAIETNDGAGALDVICRAHTQEVDGLEAQYVGAQADLRTTTAQLRTADDMARTMHAVATAEIMRNARLAAHNTQLSRIVERVRKVADLTRQTLDAPASPAMAADAANVLLADLDAAVAVPVDVPEFLPVVIAFVPEQDRTRSGHFESYDGTVKAGYALVGWSMVVRQQDAEQRRMEPTFMVEERALPESFLRDTYGLQLKHLS